MMVANKKMRRIETNIEFTLQGIKELFLLNIKKVYDCLIISEICVEELEENFTKAIKITSDKTGYEARPCFKNHSSNQHTHFAWYLPQIQSP